MVWGGMVQHYIIESVGYDISIRYAPYDPNRSYVQ